VWGRGEACAEFWWGNPRERNHWGELGIDNIKADFKEWDVGYGLG
jgi:alpha-glucosidase (family GH31 glycosyl hydrolase)